MEAGRQPRSTGSLPSARLRFPSAPALFSGLVVPGPPRLLPQAAAAGWFACLAAVISWPLVLHIGSHVPGGGAGDNVSFVWNFWWFRHALADPGAPLFFTDRLFAPFGTPLVLHTHTALQAVTGATALRSVPVLAAHNIVLLAGLWANGAAAYALAHHAVRRTLPAVLAGTMFAASSYISIRLLGHFNLVHAWVLPLALLTWIRLVERRTFARGLAVGLSLAAAAYTDYYYLLYAVLATGIWTAGARWHIGVGRRAAGPPWIRRILAVLAIGIALLATAILATGGFVLEAGGARLSATSLRNPLAGLWLIASAWCALHVTVRRAEPKDHPPAVGSTRAAAGAALAFLAATLPLTVATVSLAAAGDYAAPPGLWRSGPRGIDLLALVAGHPLNPAYGWMTREIYAGAGIDLMEQAAWLGLPSVLVLTAGAIRGSLQGSRARPWWFVSLAFLIWATGGYIMAAGLDTGLPMPQLAARFLPIVSNARVPGRAMIVVQLGAAILCALAVMRLRWRSSVLIGLTALAVADGAAAPIRLYDVPAPGPIERALAAAGPDAAVIELPTGVRDGFGETGRFDHRALLHQMTHGRPLAGGFVARLPPRVRRSYEQTPGLRALIELSASRTADDAEGRLPDDLGRRLLEAGITHVVVNTDAVPFDLRAALEARGLRLLAAADLRELYAIGRGP